ncbi:MAG: tetratricopeptide repeat protein [Alphaproteobacteria bacterium]|nr:tetratricopeptide repeat protein [Alphaproteobacteria bacterium]
MPRVTSRPASCKITGPFLAAVTLLAFCLLALTLAPAPARAQNEDGTHSYHYTPPTEMQGMQDPAGQEEAHSYHYNYKPPAAYPGGHAGSAAATPDAPVLPKKADVPFRTDEGLTSAEYYLAVGKYAEALSVLKGVLARHPDDADAFAYRGYAYEKLGDLKSAERDYRRALLIDPRHLGANRYLASLFLRGGDLSRALEQLQVIRMVCGAMDCQEQDELEDEINKYKNGQKEPDAQAAPKETAPAPRRSGYNR